MGNERGFTLMELLVALSISTFTFMGIVGIVFNIQAHVERLDTLKDLTELNTEVELSLRDRGTCTGNLRGLAFGTAGGTPAQALKAFNAAGEATATLIESGGRYGHLGILDIRLFPKAKIDERRSVAELVVSVETKAKDGAVKTRHSNLVLVKTESGRVVECASLSSASNITSEDVCSLNGTELDRTTGQCREIVGQWVFGDSSLAACPQDASPHPYVDNPCKCEEPEAFQDPLEVTRSYANGDSYGSGPVGGLSRFDETKRTCSCVYGKDVKKEGWRTAIYCIGHK